MKEIKAPVKITAEETIKFFSDNIQAVRDTVYINIPTEDDMKTESGLYVKGKAYNEFMHTVLAVGENNTDFKAGDKVYVKLATFEQQMIEGHKFAVISPFQVIAKRK